jgi:glycosyltransferase involved in cell wall biosynthesis
MPARRVVHLLGSAEPRHTAMVSMVAALAERIDPDRYALSAVFLDGAGPLTEKLDASSVPVWIVDWSGVRKEPLGGGRLWRALRAEPTALVHQHHGGRSVTWVARRATGAKIVSQLHAMVSEEPGSPRAWPVVAGADATIVVSRALADRTGWRDTRVVYPGVDLFPPTVRANEPVIVGGAGRFVPIKGFTYLLKAFRKLADVTDARLELAGDGPLRSDLEREARALGLGDRVRFLGWQRDLASTLARWSIYVQPSVHEAFGMTVLQAMASGLPVVASAADGLLELVVEGETGLLVPARDPSALAAALLTLVQEPRRRSELGAAGRERVSEQFSVEQMVAETVKVYDELLTP